MYSCIKLLQSVCSKGEKPDSFNFSRPKATMVRLAPDVHIIQSQVGRRVATGEELDFLSFVP